MRACGGPLCTGHCFGGHRGPALVGEMCSSSEVENIENMAHQEGTSLLSALLSRGCSCPLFCLYCWQRRYCSPYHTRFPFPLRSTLSSLDELRLFRERMATCQRPGLAPATFKPPTTRTTTARSISTSTPTATSSRSRSVRLFTPDRCLRGSPKSKGCVEGAREPTGGEEYGIILV